MGTNKPLAVQGRDGDAEEGELLVEDSAPYHHDNDRRPDRSDRRYYEGDRSPDRRRYRSRSPYFDGDLRRPAGWRDRSEDRDDRRRRHHQASRGRYHHARSRSRSREGRRRGVTFDVEDVAVPATNQERRQEDEDDEAFQARVAASLAAQNEDEDRLIEERRRRRQEILAKYQKSNSTTATETSPASQPPDPAFLTEASEDEDAVIQELGVVEGGGAADIFKQQTRGIETATVTASVSALPQSGFGEEPKGPELDRRLHALEATHDIGDRNTVKSHLREQNDGKDDETDEVVDDMFAETPTLIQKTDGEDGKPKAPANIPRGLVDSYDDAEGYYNFQVGEIIGDRYKVFKAHGRGVFSSVLRARDLEASSDTNQEVAIKVIRSNETMYKAGQMERVILKKLGEADPEGKRHCIKLLGSFDYRSHLCLVFEPMDMDLRALTKRYGRGIGLSLSAVRIYTQQMLIALHHLCNCGVLHADLKPDNLLVNDRRTVVKVCDFGSAMFTGSNELTPYLVSRFYRAPEVILGLPYDHPMDMWSIGCVVYELFTGQILFPGRTNNEMLKLMMDVKGPFPKRLIKKAEFAFKHFEQDPNLTFALLEEDKVTKKPIRRLISNPEVKKDFAALLAGMDADKRKVAHLADLLERMMHLDPDKRITPKDALSHPFIRGEVATQGKKQAQNLSGVALSAAPRAALLAKKQQHK